MAPVLPGWAIGNGEEAVESEKAEMSLSLFLMLNAMILQSAAHYCDGKSELRQAKKLLGPLFLLFWVGATVAWGVHR